eukprot:TRINITY_DN13999_c0_g1_i2.p2 TRINITY_DN13999_c0_g1~~TRINITY_DN13999_c0_g1_i2.p2  ORF type:complete len:165 (-),score=37.34 TRINITY_DN13999_c0_g1_i2:35-529(-)
MAGVGLYKDLSESFEKVRSSISPQQQSKQARTLYMLYHFTAVLGLGSAALPTFAIAFAIWFQQIQSGVGPVVFSSVLFGQVPVLILLNHLVLEAPKHTRLQPSQIQTDGGWTVEKLKFSISAFFDLFPAPPRIALLVTTTATRVGTETNSIVEMEMRPPATESA